MNYKNIVIFLILVVVNEVFSVTKPIDIMPFVEQLNNLLKQDSTSSSIRQGFILTVTRKSYGKTKKISMEDLTKVLGHLSGLCKEKGKGFKLVIFNEMFFSQEVPLTNEEQSDIEQALKRLSSEDSYILLCPNFLFLGEGDEKIDKEKMNDIIDKTKTL